MEGNPLDSFDGDDLEGEHPIPGEVTDSWTFTPSPEASNVEVEEADLVNLVKIIPVDSWKNFGRHLGVSENDIRAIKSAESQADERCYQLLYKWREACDSPANFGKLMDAARLVGNHRFAEMIQKFALDKIGGTPRPQLTHKYPGRSQSEQEGKNDTVSSTNPLRGTSDSVVKGTAWRKGSSQPVLLESRSRSLETGSKDKSTDVMGQPQTYESSGPLVQPRNFDSVTQTEEGKRSEGVPIPQLTNRYPRRSQSEQASKDDTMYSTNPLRGTSDSAWRKGTSLQSSCESSYSGSWESGSKDKSTDVREQFQTSNSSCSPVQHRSFHSVIESSSPPVQHGSFDSVVQTKGVRKRSSQCDTSSHLVHHRSLDSLQTKGSGTVSDVVDPNQCNFSSISTEGVDQQEYISTKGSSGHHSRPTESDHLGQASTESSSSVKQQLAAEDSYQYHQHADEQVHQNVSQQRNTPQQQEATSKGVTDKDSHEPSDNTDFPNPDKDKTELIFGVLNFASFKIINQLNACKRGPLGFQLLWVLVGIAVIIQLLATSAVSYFPLSSHQRGFTLALFLPLMTRLLPRCIFPAAIVWYVVRIVDRRINTPDVSDSREVRFRKEIEQSGNEDIVIAGTKYFFTDLDVSHKSSKQILTKIRDRLSTDLNVMLVTSFVKGIIFPVCLYLVGAFYYPEVFYSDPKYHSLARVAGFFDSLSLLLLICANGIGFAFFFHEISIRHLIACVLKIPEFTDLKLSDKLNRATKTTLNCLLNDWSKIEILLSYSIVGYSLIVVSLASAGIGLSNGIEVDQTHDFRTFWLVFIVLFMVYHFLSTAVYNIFLLRLIGTVLECLVLFVLLFHMDSVKFGPFLQILHILYPGAYLFWYVVSMMYHERMILDEKIKTSVGKAKHERRFARNLGLCCLLCLSMFLVICNEYHHLGSPKAAKAA